MDQEPSKTVLIVDDEEINRRVLSRQMTQIGYNSWHADDGITALSMINKMPPDLILLDVDMPEMDGYSLLQMMKDDENLSRIPVIMISGNDQMDLVVHCIELGAEDYLIKPPNLAMLRARITSSLEKSQKLSKSYLDTLNRLVLAAELKDEDTGEHLLRMSRYSALLAAKMGLSRHDIQNIFHAAPLHDVGKIGVPDQILLKKGKLSEVEFEQMKKHPLIGSQILANSQVEIIQVAQRIALTHHEKWNGLGYPQKLAGEAIPIEGRIVALADTFDALTSRRPYKDPYPVEVACEIIRKDSAKHFDPKVVEAFMGNLDEFARIKNEGQPENGGVACPFEYSERDLEAQRSSGS